MFILNWTFKTLLFNSVSVMSPAQAEVECSMSFKGDLLLPMWWLKLQKDTQKDVPPSKCFLKKKWSCYPDKNQGKLTNCLLTICKSISNEVLQLCNATFVLF